MPHRPFTRVFWVKYRGEIGYMIGLVGVIVALYGQHENTLAIAHQSQLGVQTHAAVCTFRGDLEQREAAARQFLRQHPGGVLGVITAKVLRSQVEQQAKAIHSLASLRCP